MIIDSEVNIPLSLQALQKLNTLPVTCVAAQGTNRLVLPRERFIFIGNGGSAAFNNSINFYFTLGTVRLNANLFWAGDVDKAVIGNYLELANIDLSAITNQPLKITSTADVTTGTGASALFIIPYRVIDLSGLI